MVVALVGVALTAAVAGWLHRQNEALIEDRLQSAAKEIGQRIEERLAMYEYGLRGARGAVLAAGGEAVTRGQFEAYVNSREMATEFPGARGFGFIRRVAPEQEPAFLARARVAQPGFQLRQLTPHADERFVIEYVFPEEANRGAAGLDVASETNRREAAWAAAQRAEVQITAPVTLVQASGLVRRGFLMLLPVYRPGQPLLTTEDREHAVIGWAYAPLLADELLSDLGPRATEVAITLTDSHESESFFRTTPANADVRPGRHEATRELQVAGRRWLMHARPLPAIERALNPLHPAWVVGIGLAITLGVALLVLQVARQRRALRELDGHGAWRPHLRSSDWSGFLRSSLAWKALLAYCLLCAAMLASNHHEALDRLSAQTRESLETLVLRQVDDANSRRLFRRKSVVFLASSPPVHAMVGGVQSGGGTVDGATPAVVASRLEQFFVAYLQANPEVHQARLMGLTGGGRELVRVERHGEAPVIVSSSGLAQVEAEPYFREALRVAPGEVFVSDAELLRDADGPRQPLQPLVHYSTPVFDSQGRAAGVLSVSVDRSRMALDQFAGRNLPDGVSLFVANRNGDYLAHPDPAKLFGHELGKRFRWTEDFVIPSSEGHEKEEPWMGPTGPVLGATAQLQSNPDTAIGSLLFIAVMPTARLDAMAWRSTLSTIPMLVGLGVVGMVMLYLYWVSMQRRLDARSQRLQLAAIVEQTSDAIIGLDRQGRVTSWNRGARELFGYQPEESVGRRLDTLIVPQGMVADELEALDALDEDPTPEPLERWRRTRDGRDVQVAITLSPLRTDDGRVAGASAIVRDVTLEREAQRQVVELNERLEEEVRERTANLAQERQRLDYILKGTNAGTWEWNVQTGETRFNERWAEIAGYTLEELSPVSIETWYRMVHPEDLAKSNDMLQRHFSGEIDQYECEARMRHRDGHWVWVLDRGRVTTWTADGRPEWMYGTHRDVTAAHTAQQRLAESEALLARTGRVAGVGGWQYDPQANQVVWTREAREIHEVAADFVPTLETMRGFYLGGARWQFEEAVSKARDRAEAFDLELPFRTAKGRELQVRVAGEPVRNSEGVVIRIDGAVQDVTERYTMEAEMRRINDLQQSILENLPCGLSAFDQDLRLVAWNAEFIRLLGLEALFEKGVPTYEDILDFNLARSEYGQGQEAIEHVERLRAYAHQPQPNRFERTRPDGTPIEVRSTPMPGGGFVTTYNDMSERRKAEREIERNEALLRGAITAVDEAFVLFDPQDRLVFCNDKYRALYRVAGDVIQPGATFEEIARTGAERGLHPDAEGRVEEWVRERVQAHLSDCPPTVQRLGDGRVVRVVERRMPDGHTVGFRLDITDMVRATEAAEAASRAKGEFLANMSHEIRTPLHAIIGLTHLLADTPLNTRQQQLVAKSQMASQSLLGIVNNVLDLAKIEAGEMPLEAEPLRPRDLLDGVDALFRQQAEGKGVALAVELDPGLPEVLVGDALRLRQVLTNLVGNALKFTEQGQVRVSLSAMASSPTQPRDTVRVRGVVRDTGVGMSPEVQARVFTPFSQADASTTRRFGGTGLGLSIVSRLIDAMGGQISVSSVAGEGSEFSFEVPLALPSNAQLGRNAARGTGLEVLVVDDEPRDRQLLTDLARAFGWRADTCESGEAALAEIERRLDQGKALPDAILMDWQLTGMDGLETLGKLSERLGQRHLPVSLMVTASERARLQRLDPRRLADAILTKPVNASVLFNAVNHGVVSRHGGTDRVKQAMGTPSGLVKSLPGVRLLVVDDSDINLEIARHLLEREGAMVTTASNGREALAVLRLAPQEFDAVLMDVQMPEMDGLEATQLLRQQPSQVGLPVIALTAGALAEERRRAIEAGMNAFLTKPLDPDLMVRTVRSVIEEMTGQPVPVASISEEATAPVQWPEIAGIDGPRAARRLGFDVALLRQSLQRLLAEFGGIGDEPWPDHLSTPARVALTRRMHKLRGAAGVIDATAVMEAAAQLESALRDDVAKDDLRPMWRALRDHLRQLAAASAAWLASPTPQPATPAQDWSDDVPERLAQLLGQNDLDALMLFEAHQASLRERLGANVVDQMADRLQGLDFEGAAALLAAQSRP